jgi:hypothetical protein
MMFWPKFVRKRVQLLERYINNVCEFCLESLTFRIQAVLVSFSNSSTASFTCAQLQLLVSALRYDQEKAAAAKLLYSRIRDTSNADLFIDLLAEADKADIRKRMGLG